MIKKITSEGFNNILQEANSKITSIEADTKKIKDNASKKIKILNYEIDYMKEEAGRLKNKIENSFENLNNGTIKFYTDLSCKDESALYRYGITNIAKYKDSPINLLNIISSKTNEAFFRNNMIDVSINGIERDYYKNIFKHDNVADKEIFFEELDETNETIIINVANNTAQSFNNSFNEIQIDTFLKGAYDIEYIRIYTSKEEYDEYKNYESIGKLLITLDKTYIFERVEFKIKINNFIEKNNNKIYPIGIKNIFFNKSNYINNGYVVIPLKINQYIDSISNNMKIKTSNGIIDTTIKDEDIEIYLDMKYDEVSKKQILISKQEPSTDESISSIALNTKTIYAKIPATSKAIIGMIFNIDVKVF